MHLFVHSYKLLLHLHCLISSVLWSPNKFNVFSFHDSILLIFTWDWFIEVNTMQVGSFSWNYNFLATAIIGVALGKLNGSDVRCKCKLYIIEPHLLQLDIYSWTWPRPTFLRVTLRNHSWSLTQAKNNPSFLWESGIRILPRTHAQRMLSPTLKTSLT